MKIKSLQDSGAGYIELCADRTTPTRDLEEGTLLELRGEGRACAQTMEHFGQRTDDPAFSYKQILD
jgi:hypothetical protein